MGGGDVGQTTPPHHLHQVRRGGIGGHRRGGPQKGKTRAAKSFYRSIFYITTFGIAFYHYNLSTDVGNGHMHD